VPAEAKRLQFIEIVGSYVRSVTQIVDKETTTDEFVTKLVESMPLTTGILPAGCVFYKRSASEGVGGNSSSFTYVFEYPAGKHTIHGASGLLGRGRTEVEMFMPNLLLTVSFRNNALMNSRLFCSKRPLSVDKMETMLYYAPLPNQYNDGRMCFGHLQLPEGVCIAEKADIMYKWLFASTWNTDLMVPFPTGWSWVDWMNAPTLVAVEDKVFYLERGTFDKIVNNNQLMRAGAE
jgi:hypothetical protein